MSEKESKSGLQISKYMNKLTSGKCSQEEEGKLLQKIYKYGKPHDYSKAIGLCKYNAKQRQLKNNNQKKILIKEEPQEEDQKIIIIPNPKDCDDIKIPPIPELEPETEKENIPTQLIEQEQKQQEDKKESQKNIKSDDESDDEVEIKNYTYIMPEYFKPSKKEKELYKPITIPIKIPNLLPIDLHKRFTKKHIEKYHSDLSYAEIQELKQNIKKYKKLSKK